MTFRGRRDHLSLGDPFFDPVQPAEFGALKVRYFNRNAATTIGLADFCEAEVERHFGRFVALPDSLPQPLALRYHGHQFQVYNPDIGDGRGFLFAQGEEIARPGMPAQPPAIPRLLDLGTKGSGTTPFSRTGDGRLTLKGAVRELLATSLLAAQGVPTSRTFALIEDLETQLVRGDEPSPTRAAVLTRLSHSHIRFGTFQALAYDHRHEELERLVRYVLRTYFGCSETGLSCEIAVQTFLQEVVRRQALKVAAWMMAGFTHGVLNTDNMNVTGESFDYGPWRWIPTYDEGFTAAYFDHQGLYAFGRQPRAVAWNLSALAAALTPIHRATQPLREILARFSPALQSATIAQFFWRTGLESSGHTATDTALAEGVLGQLKQEQSPFETLFYALSTDQRHLLSDPMRALVQGWTGSPLSYEPQTLLIDEVEVLWDAIAARDDWEPLNHKIRLLDQLYRLRRAWDAPSVRGMETRHD